MLARGRGSCARVTVVVLGGVLTQALIVALAVWGFGAVGGRSEDAVPEPYVVVSASRQEPASPTAVVPSDEGSWLTPAPPLGAPSVAPAQDRAPTTLELLGKLEVKGRAPKTGYDRELQFGPAWEDVDANGCDTRNDILARDLTGITADDRCRVLAGVLHDPYTGRQIEFVRGAETSVEVQIDHVVALMDAWQKGAQQLTFEERVAFANDPANLIAVDGGSNQQKGAGDAATWLPANKAFRCAYVSRQIQVKASWALWVTSAEKDAMLRVLAACLSP